MDEVAEDYALIMAPVFLELLVKDIDEGRKGKKKTPQKKTDKIPSEVQKKKKEITIDVGSDLISSCS